MISRLDQLLEGALQEYSHRIAVEDSSGRQMRYGELGTASKELQERLAYFHIGPGDRVALYLEKSIEAIAAIFSILKTGACYVPIDPEGPVSRNTSILIDCAADALLIEEKFIPGFRQVLQTESYQETARFDSICLFVRSPRKASEKGPNHLAYILYTSGSTGQPKGVAISHHAALSFINWASRQFEISPKNRFASHAPFHFDLSIFDLFVSLSHGATLVLVDPEIGRQPRELAPFISEKRISVWYSTPTVLKLLVRYAQLVSYDYSLLRLVLFAGEVFSPQPLRTLKKIWSRPAFFNLYGPTETNVCTYYEIPEIVPENQIEAYPIGKNCSHAKTRVEQEELQVAGPCLMEGYWNRPEETAKAFVQDEKGECWYKTGDLVREEPDGNYIFLGRRDRLVKRRGARVELGEIENALYQHPHISEAAVVALPDEENGVILQAFLCLDGGERVSLVELKQFCVERLPTYMIPDRFSFCASLPKTSTDKIDYQLLKQWNLIS